MIYGLIVFGIIVLICTGIIFAIKLEVFDVDDVGICLVSFFISVIITLFLLLFVIILPFLLCAAIITSII